MTNIRTNVTNNLYVTKRLTAKQEKFINDLK